jgi:hypothetical protein
MRPRWVEKGSQQYSGDVVVTVYYSQRVYVDQVPYCEHKQRMNTGVLRQRHGMKVLTGKL